MASLTMLLGGAAALAGGRLAYVRLAGRAKVGADMWVKGGFQQKMDAKEAKLILGIRDPISVKKVKDAHRRIMIVNHPDRGGAPYLASKINEAKDLLEKSAPR